MKTWIYLIIFLYDGDGSPESPSSVPVVCLVVGFVEASVSVVISVKPVALVWPSVGVGVGVGVGGFKQLQIKNHNNSFSECGSIS